MLWYILIGVIITLLVVLDRWKPNNLKKLHDQLKCNFLYLPIIGHCYKILSSEGRFKTYLDLARQSYKNKHGMASMWFGNRLYVGIADPLQAKIVLKTCLDKGEFERITNDVLGNTSAYGPVEQWQQRRKILSAVLATRFNKNYVDILKRHSEDLSDKLLSKTLKGDFSIWEYFYGYSLDMISETATGININIKDRRSHPFFKAIEECMVNLVSRVSQPLQHIDAVYEMTASCKKQMDNRKLLEEFTNQLITKRKTLLESERNGVLNNSEQNSNQTTLLELMLDISRGEKNFSDVAVMEEILMVILAATDTTATTASFVCVLLSIYPDIQEKMFDEITNAFGESKGPINLEDLEKLKYTEAVIREVIRLYPPGPIIFRDCDKDVTLPTGITLQKGTACMINILGINRNPQYWGKDAEEFRPERFLEGAPSHPAAFMSFSHGPRNCIGQYFAMVALKIVFANMLQRYRITPATCYQNEKQVKLAADIMLKPVHDYKIQIETRA